MTPYIEDFDKARKLWPGVKRGCDTEFACLKKHKDWKKVVPLLYSAIEQQIIRHHNKLVRTPCVFVPPWKNFKTWLNNRCWEETEGTDVDPNEEAKREQARKERKKQKDRDHCKAYFQEKSNEKLQALLAESPRSGIVHIYGWVIEEILSERAKQ